MTQSYDAWRTAGPDDSAKAAPETEFTRHLEIWPLNETESDCVFSTDSDGLVYLETVIILGRKFSATEIEEWLGASEMNRLTHVGQAWWDTTGFDEYMRDRDDDRGDYLRDMRDDM